MGIIIDICIVAVLALSIFLGYKRGLVGLAFKIISFATAIVISLALFYPISNFIINNTQIDDKLEEIIVSRFVNEEKNNEEENNSNNIITKQIQEAAETTAENAMLVASTNIARTIINFGVMLIIYLITRLILLIFKSISEKIADLPIIKQFNEVGGIIYGIIVGFLIVYIIFAVISLSSSLFNSGELINNINQSTIGKIVYNNNIILKLLF